MTDKWTESSIVQDLITLFDANTILKADSDDTPEALTIAASRIVGRKSTGDIEALTAAEVVAILSGTIKGTDVEVSELSAATYDDIQDYINFFEVCRVILRVSNSVVLSASL